jgi:hypothetical protein
VGSNENAKAKVAWEKVCVPKKEGGLGLKRLNVWNQAAMLRHIWNLYAQARSLWVAWVDKNWLKWRSFWQIPILQSCSWSWKQILKLREVAKRFLKFKVGDGNRIFLWLDVWNPHGCLLDKYGYRVVYDAGSSIGAKLSTIIRNGEWYWPYARSDRIVDIQSKRLEVEIGNSDLPMWRCKKGRYTCAETWDALRKKEVPEKWWKVLWNQVAIPRHSFMLWLVFRDALITKERMCRWGYSGDGLSFLSGKVGKQNSFVLAM